MYALISIKGTGHLFVSPIQKKADLHLKNRTESLINAYIDKNVTIIENSGHFKIPQHFLDRQKDFKGEN